jgi:hypothetical protein
MFLNDLVLNSSLDLALREVQAELRYDWTWTGFERI